MQIRPFHKEDQAAVIQLWEECGLTRPWNSPDKDIARKLTTQPEWFLVGTIDDRIVATLMAGYDGHRGWINYLGVDPDPQRQGLAKMMMEEAERLLLDFGCPKINLLIRGDNVEAIEFYKQIGFTEDAVVNFGKRLIPDE
jgi:ribosomal protein S18 acetylase RimI-like enzyme